jgi:hypothetical protein
MPPDRRARGLWQRLMRRLRPPVHSPTDQELVETVWARARRDARLWSQGTFVALPLLCATTGFGVYVASGIHAARQPPSAFLEDIVGPVVGLSAGLILVFGVHVLLTFRLQRNEARLARQDAIKRLTRLEGSRLAEGRTQLVGGIGASTSLLPAPAPGETIEGMIFGQEFKISNPAPAPGTPTAPEASGFSGDEPSPGLPPEHHGRLVGDDEGDSR